MYFLISLDFNVEKDDERKENIFKKPAASMVAFCKISIPFSHFYTTEIYITDFYTINYRVIFSKEF